jgi:DNA integrity scanning protein DisA with diadenylate cyclase activity
MDTAIEIIKWALLILLAGFIGQFGKSFSLRVIHYFQDKTKKKISPAAEAEQEADRAGKVDSIDPDHKTEKKMLKAQSKLEKKKGKLKK